MPGQPFKHSGWGQLCCPFPSRSLVHSPLLAEGSIWTRPQLSWPQYLGAGLAAVQALGCSMLCPIPALHLPSPAAQGKPGSCLPRRCCSSYESVNGLVFQIFFHQFSLSFLFFFIGSWFFFLLLLMRFLHPTALGGFLHL